MARKPIDKSVMIDRIADETGYSKRATTDIVDRLLLEITRQLRGGETVRFLGFGKFELRFRESRQATNLQTGEPMMTEAKNYPHFTPGRKLKESVNS